MELRNLARHTRPFRYLAHAGLLSLLLHIIEGFATGVLLGGVGMPLLPAGTSLAHRRIHRRGWVYRARRTPAGRSVGSLLERLLRARSERWHADGHLVRLSVRAGIASGYCSLGDWGRERLDFTIIGAPVNLSQRLQTHAAAGGALMCAATGALVAQGAPGHVGASSKFQLKGLGEVVGHPLVDLPIRSANVPARSAYRAAERRKKVDQVG